jgi:hypothetical protein
VGNYRLDSYRNELPPLTGGSICIAIAAGLIIGVVLVGRRAASETLSGPRSTKMLVEMAVTAAILIAIAVALGRPGCRPSA